MDLGETQRGRIEGRVEGILRVGVFLCFVGHGAFGLLRKEAWLAYLGALGIGPEAGMALWSPTPCSAARSTWTSSPRCSRGRRAAATASS